jgi:hypothetical protein
MPKNMQIPKVVLNPISTSYLFTRNPWMAVWWSIILPGFGHLTLGQSFKGLLLMSWEILINHQAHINLAIYHTVLGHIDQARTALDYRWAVLYPTFYVFTMWDSYRISVEYNHLDRLERLQKRRRFDRASVSPLGIHGLDRRNPALAAFWSVVMTGLGHMYSNRMLKAIVLMAWYLAIILKSGLSLAFYHTVLGQYELAHKAVDYQWLLFWPSIFVFGIVDAYADVVEQNNLADAAFQYRLRKYLKNEDARRGGPVV